jgi:hypothetical protein
VWGISAAFAGVVWGTSWWVLPPGRLPNLAAPFLGMQVNIVAVPVAAVHISWWDGVNPVGNFVGGGVGIGAAVLGGTCTFEWGKC